VVPWLCGFLDGPDNLGPTLAQYFPLNLLLEFITIIIIHFKEFYFSTEYMLPILWSFLSVVWLIQKTGPLLSHYVLGDRETTVFGKGHPIIFVNLLPKFHAPV